jgi:hypothetical protein
MLYPARKREIATALRRGGMFPCHKSVDYSNDDGGRTTRDSVWCAGALLTMENDPAGAGAAENQLVRISQRLGMLDLEALQGKDRVFGSLREWCAAGKVRRAKPCPNCGQRHGANGICTDGAG